MRTRLRYRAPRVTPLPLRVGPWGRGRSDARHAPVGKPTRQGRGLAIPIRILAVALLAPCAMPVYSSAQRPLFAAPPLPAAAVQSQPRPAVSYVCANPQGDAGGDPTAAAEPPAGQPADTRDRREEDKLGQQPPDSSLDFLRQSTVLLDTGTIEVERSIEFASGSTRFLAVLGNGTLLPETTDARTLLATCAIRYGYSERWQPSIVAPVGLATLETAHQLTQQSDEVLGIGDVQFGSSFLLRDGQDECADVVLSTTLTAPTGAHALLAPSPTTASLGNGFWAISTSTSWTRAYDPVVVFAAVGYTHRFGRRIRGQRIQPGEQLTLAHGLGLAINDEITYGLQFDYAHQFDTKIGGVDVHDSGVDVASIRHSAIIRTAPQSFWEVFVAAGLTDSATAISTGAIFTQRY